MKTALVSMMNNEFYIAFEVFIKSLLYHNTWFISEKIPFVIIDLSLSSKTKEQMLSWYPYIIFKEPMYTFYNNVNMKVTPEVLKCTYYKIDMFSLWDYERVIFIDLDTTIVGDIHGLLDVAAPIAACRGYNLVNDNLRHDVNSGVIVINKEYLNSETYQGLLSFIKQGFSMPDQKCINGYFRKKIAHLPKKYNCEKRMMKSKAFKDLWDNEKVIIHWISEKPWQKKTHPSNQGFEKIVWRKS